jgi:hypothetical protein
VRSGTARCTIVEGHGGCRFANWRRMVGPGSVAGRCLIRSQTSSAKRIVRRLRSSAASPTHGTTGTADARSLSPQPPIANRQSPIPNPQSPIDYSITRFPDYPIHLLPILLSYSCSSTSAVWRSNAGAVLG